MKTFNQFVTEVQAPLSQGEKNFFNAHNPVNYKDLVPGVTDQEHVFNGSPQRKDPRTASYEGDASTKAYDKNLKVSESLEEKTLTPAEMKKREEIVKSLKRKGMEKSKAYPIATATAKRVAEEDDGWYAHREMHGSKGVSKEDWKKGVRLNSKGERVQMKKEEIEQIDELDRDGMVKRYAEKARKKVEYGEEPVDKRAAGRLLAGKKRWGGAGGIPAAKVPAVTREEAEIIDERNKENKFKKDLHTASVGKKEVDKFDVDHDKMAKDFGHSRDRVRDTMKARLKHYKQVGRKMTKEEAEQIDELSDKMLASMQKNDLMKNRKDAKASTAGEMSTKKPANEEHLDEISKEKALNYIGAASYDKSSHASDIGAINQTARTTGTHASQRDERDKLSKKHGNRSLGIQRAAHKLANKHVKVPATEEVVNELDFKRGGILNRYLSKTNPEHSSPKEIEKRKAGRAMALSKKWADASHGDIEPKIKAKDREEAELDEAKSEESNSPDQNIQTQLHKAHSVGKKVMFKNGEEKQIPAAHVQKALHMLKSAKPSQRLEIQNSLHHSHDRFTKTVTHGRPVVDHPGQKKISVAKSVKEEVDPTTTASDRGAVKTAVRLSPDGRPMLIKRTPPRDEIKIGEALDPVGKEDSDIDNDGKHHTKTDKYLHNRRKSIKAAIRGAVKEAEELTSAAVAKAASSQTAKAETKDVNMQQDSINKLKSDPSASDINIKLPPTQGNDPVGGESERVGGKFSVEEEIVLESLYDVLSDENKEIFEELLNTDEGIERLLDFAKEMGI